MCLTTLNKNPNVKSGRGYKLLWVSPSGKMYAGLISQYRQEIKLGVLVKDKLDFDLFTDSPGPIKSYPAGFHIFRSKNGLRIFQRQFGWRHHDIAIVEVQYCDAVATGIQKHSMDGAGSRVVVARKFTATKVLQTGGILKK